jgi:hypothetical protein
MVRKWIGVNDLPDRTYSERARHDGGLGIRIGLVASKRPGLS